MHRLLYRQIRRFLGDPDALPEDLRAFIDAVDAAYQESDDDRAMTERSLDLVSLELVERNQAMRAETKRRADQLEDENRRYQEMSRAKSEMLATLSHELRSPLNAIMGFAELLLARPDGSVSDPDRQMISQILASSEHLKQLVDDILDSAKAEAGRWELHPEVVQVQAVVRDVLTTLEPVAAKNGVVVTLEPHEELSGYLDAVRLRQVIYNYVSNAIKFTPEGGHIVVCAAADDKTLCLEVTDTGIGIAAADLPRLFTDFSQVGGGSRTAQGTGLGLSITKRLVEAQGGTVGVRSVVGSGSTFWARLPLRAGFEAGPSAST